MEHKIKIGDIVIAPKRCKRWLTSGKEYTVVDISGGTVDAFSIKDDDGDLIYCLPERCNHLFLNNWIIKH